MNLLSYIIWNGSPEIFSIGPVTLRWYGLLFAIGFLLSQQILYYIYKKEGKPEKDVDTLTIYMVIATIIGARLGHVLFYEPERYFANPIDILKIWEGGLASHGAAVGILFALWLYARKKKPGQSYLQVLDRIVILVALTGALIRLGNFFNSEIIGKETSAGYGVVFVRNVTEILQRDPEVKKISYQSSSGAPNESGYKPIKLLIEFNADRQSEQELHMYMTSRFYDRLIYNTYINEHINQSTPIKYIIAKQDDGNYAALVETNAIARHPAQLYESISCILLFVLLYWMWSRQKQNLPPGRIFGTFMIILWSLRFIYEYLKEVQVPAELSFIDTYGINYGQLYSIPLVIVGIIVLVFSFKQNSKDTVINEKNS